MTNKEVAKLSPKIESQLKEIGRNITKHRQSVNGNYKKFAEIHNFNNMTIWRIESGKDYRMSSFLEILNAIGITPEQFFQNMK